MTRMHIDGAESVVCFWKSATGRKIGCCTVWCSYRLRLYKATGYRCHNTWERCVKSHISKCLLFAVYTYPELTTVPCSVNSIYIANFQSEREKMRGGERISMRLNGFLLGLAHESVGLKSAFGRSLWLRMRYTIRFEGETLPLHTIQSECESVMFRMQYISIHYFSSWEWERDGGWEREWVPLCSVCMLDALYHTLNPSPHAEIASSPRATQPLFI